MRRICSIDFCKAISRSELEKQISANPCNQKKTILDYLYSKPISAYASGVVFDVFQGKETEVPNAAREDDEYIWLSAAIYYFEHYNLILNDDFVQHVLGRSI